MKLLLKQSLVLTGVLMVLLVVVYPLFIAGIAMFSDGKGNGVAIEYKGKVVGYENIGQSFTEDKFFNGRPSAVNYNAAGSGGSNKGPSNPEYLKLVQERIDTFLVHNPDIKKSEIPSELVTASGSGLDPHISPNAAYVQIKRISKVRMMSEDQLKKLVDASIEKPFLGPQVVNVLKLNIALENTAK
jgi:K+-transporting ATPase ATPase C chain